MKSTDLRPRQTGRSVEDLVAAATERAALVHDGKSGALIERLVVDGQPVILKHLSMGDDWIRRATGDLGCRFIMLWELGVLDALPACLDTAVVDVARDGDGWDGAVLMHDVSAALVPMSDDPIPLEQHRRFIDHMAALHARFSGLDDEWGLLPLAHRVVELGPLTYAAEQAGGHDPVPPRLAAAGWERLPRVAPATAEVVRPLFEDPTPLVRAATAGPWTLIHGNWKLDNLGSHRDGTTVLLDWGESTGRAPGAFDLTWYLAINCRRLPESKEATIDAYRAALEGHGVETGSWWDRQLAAAIVGAFMQLGWEKALGERDDELSWWDGQVTAAAEQLA